MAKIPYLSDDLIVRKRLNEHESVISPSIPSVTVCLNDTLRFFNSLSSGDDSKESKRYKAIASLNNMRFLMERIPDLRDTLAVDLHTFSSVISDSAERIFSLTSEKKELEGEVERSLQTLKEMNELEKESIKVNVYPSREELQNNIEKIQNHITRIDAEILKLRTKVEEGSKRLRSIYESFRQVKNDILGIQIQEDLNDEENGGAMEVEEWRVCFESSALMVWRRSNLIPATRLPNKHVPPLISSPPPTSS